LQFDTLIFDLDGTLSDPKLGVVRCMNYALTSFDYPPRAEAEIAQYIGPPLEETIQRLTDSNDDQHIDELVAKYRERYFEVGYKENELYADIAEMLSALSNHNFRMGFVLPSIKPLRKRSSSDSRSISILILLMALPAEQQRRNN